MDLIHCIHTRRSIRTFRSDRVADDTLQQILAAGMQAPSALDAQPWQFIVIREPGVLQELPNHHSHCQLVSKAPAAILVCGDRSLEKLPDFWVQDCAAATQNLLLAAHSMGLGAVWIGVYPTRPNVEGLRTFMGLPESITPFALIALGYPDEPYPEKDNFREERIHWEKW